MDLRPVGRTGVSVSKLCLGAMMLGSYEPGRLTRKPQQSQGFPCGRRRRCHRHRRPDSGGGIRTRDLRVMSPTLDPLNPQSCVRSHRRNCASDGRTRAEWSCVWGAENGEWRKELPYETPAIDEFRRGEDRQLAELIRIAAYTGLRRGELVALRWRDVRSSERVLVVERALSGSVERTTKGRRIRYVPLADQALAALDRLSQRRHFVGPDDYVFASVAGDRLDPSALRRRFVAARDAAGVPRLRFRDLRHTAGTLLTRVLDRRSNPQRRHDRRRHRRSSARDRQQSCVSRA
jgi:hypothetical protein